MKDSTEYAPVYPSSQNATYSSKFVNLNIIFLTKRLNNTSWKTSKC